MSVRSGVLLDKSGWKSRRESRPSTEKMGVEAASLAPGDWAMQIDPGQEVGTWESSLR